MLQLLLLLQMLWCNVRHVGGVINGGGLKRLEALELG
jgi:hypothetical protein